MPEKFEYPPVGRCIYCDSIETLSDEHIVPKSFGGRHILPKASCKMCQIITGAFEQYCAWNIYGTFRIKNNFPTRHRKQRPKFLPRITRIDGEYKTTQVDPSHAPIWVPLINFALPGYLKNPPVRETGWEGTTVKYRGLGSITPYEGGTVFPKIEHPIFDINPFARMLAKIAHGYCVGEFGADAFEHWLRPYILGDDLTLSYLVGNIPTGIGIGSIVPSDRYYSMIPRPITLVDTGENLLGVEIWLFEKALSSFVIVGKPKTQH